MSSHNTRASVKVWIDAVTEATQQRKSNKPRSRKPRLSPVSQPLAPTTYSPRPSKRLPERAAYRINPGRACKRRKRMADNHDNAQLDDEGRRGRGRGRGRFSASSRPSTRAATADALGQRKGRSSVEDHTETLSDVVPSTIFEPPSLGSAPRSRTASPVKSPSTGSGKSFADIDMIYLESCTPSVQLKALSTARKSGQVPQAVIDLYMTLTDTPCGCIPLTLKVSFRSSLVVWL